MSWSLLGESMYGHITIVFFCPWKREAQETGGGKNQNKTETNREMSSEGETSVANKSDGPTVQL